MSQLASRDMRIIEDLSKTALPPSGDDASCLVQGAAKYEQLGTPCMQTILDSVLEGVDLQTRGAFMLVDMRVKTAHTLMAFLVRRQAYLKALWLMPPTRIVRFVFFNT